MLSDESIEELLEQLDQLEAERTGALHAPGTPLSDASGSVYHTVVNWSPTQQHTLRRRILQLLSRFSLPGRGAQPEAPAAAAAGGGNGGAKNIAGGSFLLRLDDPFEAWEAAGERY